MLVICIKQANKQPKAGNKEHEMAI